MPDSTAPEPPPTRGERDWPLPASQELGDLDRPSSTLDSVVTRPRWGLHIALYLATGLSTFFAGQLWAGLEGGLIYSLSIMTILTAHELGHYVQARRYGVPASPPYFIPFPLPPFGTLGAVIAMRPQRSQARALFDLAISGPLAGLVPTIIFTLVGLRLSSIVERSSELAESSQSLSSPLIFQLLSRLAVGSVPPDQIIELHPMAFAGWVGIFITALNLLPVGQLDGGHILYTLQPSRAYRISQAFLAFAVAAIILGGLWHYALLVLLLWLMGPKHPPTVDLTTKLSRRRIILGWLALSFIILGLTPNPFDL